MLKCLFYCCLGMDICFLLFQHGYMYICFAIRDGQGNQQAHEFVSSFCWPKKWQTFGMTGRNVFEKRTLLVAI